MKNLSIYILFLSLLALSACSNENYFDTNAQPQSGEALILSVSASNFATDGLPASRATDSGSETTFEEGDRVGIIILDGSGKLLADNIPYVYSGTGRSFDSSNTESKSQCYYDNKAVTYIAYYPYSSTANGITSEGALKTEFPPQHDQHTKEAYRASDLLVWTPTSTTPLKKLDIEFKHAYSLLSLSPSIKYITDGPEITYAITSASDVNVTITNNYYLPYKEDDGSFRIIVASQTSAIRWFFTDITDTYKGAITQTEVVANTRYTLPTIPINYTLDKAQIGDFYCISSDGVGYLIPKDVPKAELGNHTCLGIVLKSGRDDDGDWVDNSIYKQKDGITPMPTINGYVLALNDANAGNTCVWNTTWAWHRIETNTDFTGFHGYANTNKIKAYVKTSNQNLITALPATYHATDGYEILDNGKYSAPAASSGWFLPSAGQLEYWINNRDVLLESIKKTTGNADYTWKDGDGDGDGYGYWSSSEALINELSNVVRCLFFNPYYYMTNTFKHYPLYVRSVLAF